MNIEPEIPLARVAAFVRQHTHDIRNGLNCLDLETSLLRELVTDDEGRESLERVRGQVRSMADEMRSLASLFQEPQPLASPIAAKELLEIWQEQCAATPTPPDVEWVNELGDEHVCVDVAMMASVFHELLTNAADFSQGGKATVTARRKGNDVMFELREPKSGPLDTSGWGEAFSTTRRGGYGLGLWSARRLVEANGATLMQGPAPGGGGLVSRISMPVV